MISGARNGKRVRRYKGKRARGQETSATLAVMMGDDEIEDGEILEGGELTRGVCGLTRWRVNPRGVS